MIVTLCYCIDNLSKVIMNNCDNKINQVFYIFNTRKLLSEQKRLPTLNLCRTYHREPSIRPPKLYNTLITIYQKIFAWSGYFLLFKIPMWEVLLWMPIWFFQTSSNNKMLHFLQFFILLFIFTLFLDHMYAAFYRIERNGVS